MKIIVSCSPSEIVDLLFSLVCFSDKYPISILGPKPKGLGTTGLKGWLCLSLQIQYRSVRSRTSLLIPHLHLPWQPERVCTNALWNYSLNVFTPDFDCQVANYSENVLLSVTSHFWAYSYLWKRCPYQCLTLYTLLGCQIITSSPDLPTDFFLESRKSVHSIYKVMTSTSICCISHILPMCMRMRPDGHLCPD